eukprot:512445-Rhodomonas_salina.1
MPCPLVRRPVRTQLPCPDVADGLGRDAVQLSDHDGAAGSFLVKRVAARRRSRPKRVDLDDPRLGEASSLQLNRRLLLDNRVGNGGVLRARFGGVGVEGGVEGHALECLLGLGCRRHQRRL